MNFLVQDESSHKDPFLSSLGHDASLGPQVIQHNTDFTLTKNGEYREDDKFARVHIYMVQGERYRRDGNLIRFRVCGCGKDFDVPAGLKRDEKIHKGLCEFFCSVQGCPYERRGFARKDHLVRHRKTHVHLHEGTVSKDSGPERFDSSRIVYAWEMETKFRDKRFTT
jgi:hypothetical protein